MTTASAPGKIILVGEHAVVYGRPAIAVPLWERCATAVIESLPPGSGCRLDAPAIDLNLQLSAADGDQPLAMAVRLALEAAGGESDPDWQVTAGGTIPVASGLGSGAAICSALVRVVFAHLGKPIDAGQVSDLVYACERIFHGTPSGIDNSVVAHAAPIWFIRGKAPQPFFPRDPFDLLIADSGISAPTIEVVADVRRGWEQSPQRYESWFDEIASVVCETRSAIDRGDHRALGHLFDRNQLLLTDLEVSSPQLDRLIAAARQAGALGAKLSGAGQGGNVIALVEAENREAVADALLAAGAQQVILTTVYAGMSRSGSRK